MKKFSLPLQDILLILATAFCSSSYASGFYNELQSTSAMGNAFAGAGVAGDDASIMFYNPAGIALFDEPQFVVSGIYAMPEGVFTAESVTDALGFPVPSASGQEYSGIPSELSPAVYAITPLDDQFTLGMSFLSPYFLKTDYSNTPIDTTARQLEWVTYTGNLSLAMEVTEALSLAVGGNLQYFKAKMNANFNGTDTTNGLTVRGLTEYTGDDIAFYPNFGAIYEFNEHTRLGLNYRMNVKQETEGDYSSTIILTDTTTGDEIEALIENPANSVFYFPDIVSLDFFHQFNERIELLATAMFMRWNQFQNVKVEIEQEDFANGEPISTEIALQNTWSFALGGNYYFTEDFKLRLGAAYEQSPVPEDDVLLQGPDSDRVNVSVGLMYQPEFWDNGHFDLAYMHTFFQDSNISQINPLNNTFPGAFPGVSAAGTYKTYANYVGLQVVYDLE